MVIVAPTDAMAGKWVYPVTVKIYLYLFEVFVNMKRNKKGSLFPATLFLGN
jgi:hypothetical protein